MNAEGFATVMAGSLACNMPGADWHFSIRRVDGSGHSRFFDFHKKEVLATDIAAYLPNWETLQWTEIKDNLLGKSESYARDIEFKVNVQSTEIGTKSHKEVVEAFRAFMRTAHTAALPKVGFVITNPLTGNPMKQTPDGISLDDKVFSTKEDLELFVQQHWQNAVICAEVKA
jgi:hypothetical protein